MLRRRCGALLLGLALAGCASPTSPAPPADPAASAPAGAPPADALPSVLPPAEAPFAVGDLGDTRYSCDEAPGFLPRFLAQPANAELEDHPSAAALRTAIAEVGPDIDLLPESGYWLVDRDDQVAQYIAREPAGDPPFVTATIEYDGAAWTLGGWGQCRPHILLDGLSLATWTLDPDAPPPDATAKTFTALVTERTCTGGKPMGARLQPPSIMYGQDAVLVVFAAIPPQGDGFDCQGNPSTRVVVQLREALGDRRLLDAGFFPPAEPVAPEF